MLRRTQLPATLTLLALGLAGCCRTPIYLEPGGHSTTYRRHLEHYDRTVMDSIEAVSFVESAVVPAPESTPPETNAIPPTLAP